MDGIVFKTDGTKEEFEWQEPTLDQLQGFVGGFIELVYVRYEGEEREAYINEEGKLDGLPVNGLATLLYNFVDAPACQVPRFPGAQIDPIMGNMVVVLNPLTED